MQEEGGASRLLQFQWVSVPHFGHKRFLKTPGAELIRPFEPRRLALLVSSHQRLLDRESAISP
jgi:hypothetical protein